MLCSNKPSYLFSDDPFCKGHGHERVCLLQLSSLCTWSSKIIYLKFFLGMSFCLAVVSLVSVQRLTYVWSGNILCSGVLMCVEERCHCVVVCFEKLPELWWPDKSD